jgi:organic anion transporter 5A
MDYSIAGLFDGWMVGWLDGWMVGWLDGWMVGWFKVICFLLMGEG